MTPRHLQHSARPVVTFTGAEDNVLVADLDGPLDGQPVVLLHGGGQTRHSWARAFDELVARGYRVLSLDCRGHGDSQWSPCGDYSLDALVADLRRVLASLSRPAVLVGASLGGVTALIAQGEDPQLARALILVDVAPQLEFDGVDHIVNFMTAHTAGFASLEDVAAAVAAYNPTRPRPTDHQGLRKNVRLAEDGRFYWHWDPRLMEGDHRGRTRDISRRMLAAAAHVKVPTLLVRGKQSDVVSLEGAEHLRRHLPHLQLVDIEGAGHMVAGDKNDAFNGAIITFLQQQSQ
ncbi:alpha/beta hydrolase [Pseudomonas baltica]|uniref:alpha/beta fold hydrolase n=1 Tax=Pseudomonas baltica TaxID=2762576 RepID=UPI00289BC644|nr:alpha/beta hydrolase [Pseudomonas baltica]